MALTQRKQREEQGTQGFITLFKWLVLLEWLILNGLYNFLIQTTLVEILWYFNKSKYLFKIS